jgi:hypothetical protein
MKPAVLQERNQPYRDGGTQDEFVLAPLGAVREQWRRLMSSSDASTLYHGERWLEVLHRAYGFDFVLAGLRADGEIVAACLLARSAKPFRSRLIALPFSDLCPPVARDERSRRALMAALASRTGESNALEIRGIAADSPWQVLAGFDLWECDLRARVGDLACRVAVNFRRNLSKALAAEIRVACADSAEYMARFYALHRGARRRLGLPAQPARFFEAVRRVFAPCGDLEVWIASHQGHDVAAAVTLRERDRLYYKWSARAPGRNPGAGHLLLWSIIQRHAERAVALDLGRADRRNAGLTRFKRESGASARPLPYSFFPRAPHDASAEVLNGARAAAARVWRRLPAPVCRAIESSLYRYLA